MNITISAGGNHSLALTTDGKVICWGDNSRGQCDLPEEYKNLKFIAVSAGSFHSLGLTVDGMIIGWGSNGSGQRKLPKKYKDLTFIAVSAGYFHSLALTSDGKVIGWGYNDFDQTDIPEEYKNLKFIAVSAGGYHSLALTDDGKIVGWGFNEHGQSKLPEEYKNLKFITVSAGSFHSLALSDGKVICWGDNDFGQTEIPEEYNDFGQTEIPEEYNDLTFIAVSAGSFHSLGLTRDGKVIGWGANGHGQSDLPPKQSIQAHPLGSSIAGPQKGEKYKDLKFIAVSAGGSHSLGLTEDGNVIGGGDNELGQCHCPSQEIAIPYDYVSRINRNLKTLGNIPKYIKMKILEQFNWSFWNLYHL